MLELVPVLLLGVISGAVIGWVIGHQWSSHAKQPHQQNSETDDSLDSAVDEQARIEAVTRKIRSLTLSVAADMSAHQSKVADITTDLEASASQSHTEAIVATVAELVAVNKAMQEKLDASQQQIREQSKQLQTTQQLANTDALTGLANRRVLDAELAKVGQVHGAKRGTLALIDVDHFKSVNDKYGHPTGDLVLSRVAELLDANLGDCCLCSRFGGEEFAVFHSAADWELVAKLLEQTRIQLASLRLIPEDQDRQITFSCGLAPHAGDETNDEWLARVDAALYAAKRDDRNNLQVDESGKVRRYSPVSLSKTEAAKEREQASPVSVLAPCVDSKLDESSNNRQCLVSQLRTMAANIDLDRVGVAAVAIRLPDSQYQPEDQEEFLAQTRGLLRSVDRIGFDDQRTMLALMVTSDLRKTEERANQLLDSINRTLTELQLLNGDMGSASVGISMLDHDSSADEVIAVAVKRASEQIAAGY